MFIEKLNDTQNAIVVELYSAVKKLGGKSDILCILGSWGDTLPEHQILKMLREWNLSEQPQDRLDQHKSDASSDLPMCATHLPEPKHSGAY
jgi:hypothetical protein